jgi:hypothetical protein
MSDKPIRKIKNTGSRKNTGYFPSEKNERSIAYESLLERDYLYLLEFDKDVISYTEQPLTLEYNVLSRKRTYTPDLKVVRKEKTQIIEIKPKEKLLKFLSDEKEKMKFDAAKYYCCSKGYEFKFVTDEDIHNGNILGNIKYLFRYSKVKVLASDELKIKNQLAKGAVSIEELLNVIEPYGEQNEYKMYIYSLIYEGILKIDIKESITDRTIVTL